MDKSGEQVGRRMMFGLLGLRKLHGIPDLFRTLAPVAIEDPYSHLTTRLQRQGLLQCPILSDWILPLFLYLKLA